MKYCAKCGKKLPDDSVFCNGCGYHQYGGQQPYGGQPSQAAYNQYADRNLLNELSHRYQINGIIWIVVAAIQLFLGLFFFWIYLIVGGINMVWAIQDMNYSKSVLNNPVGIVGKVRPLTNPIISLVYNVMFGGIIGIAGSIYYLTGIRSFVMNNESAFARIGTEYTNNMYRRNNY